MNTGKQFFETGSFDFQILFYLHNASIATLLYLHGVPTYLWKNSEIDKRVLLPKLLNGKSTRYKDTAI